jgi:hypothetical protein
MLCLGSSKGSGARGRFIVHWELATGIGRLDFNAIKGRTCISTADPDY